MPVTWGEVAPKAEVLPTPLPANEGRNKPRFHLVLNKDAWTWDPGVKEYLPTLTKMHLSPGVNGVGESGGIIDASAAIQREVSRGRMVLFDGDPRLHVPGDPSPRLREGRFRGQVIAATSTPGKGRACYVWAWDGYEVAHGRVEWVEDAEMRRRFQRHLVRSGIVPAMPYTLRAIMLRDAQKRLHNMEERRATTGQGQARLARMREFVEDLRADLAKHTTAADKRPPVVYDTDSAPLDVEAAPIIIDGQRVVEAEEF
jgi:hypothetical protein